MATHLGKVTKMATEKAIDSHACLAVACLFTLFASMSYGNTIWYSNREKNTSEEADGNKALSNLSYWKDENGTVGSDSDAPSASDDLIFDNCATSGSNPVRLRFSATSFAANSLQIGTDVSSNTVVMDAFTFSNAHEGLKLKYGNWWFNKRNADMSINCDVTVLAEDASKPFVIHFGQASYSNCIGRITGKLKGSKNAQLWFGRKLGLKLGDLYPVSALNSTFYLYDISDYAGTITVSSDKLNDIASSQYGVRLNLATGTMASAAKLNIDSNGSLAVSASGTVTVSDLSFAAGTYLWVDSVGRISKDEPFLIRATNSLTVATGGKKIEVLWRPFVGGNGVCRIPILAGPASSTFTENDFKLTPLKNYVGSGVSLEVDNDPDTGDRTLYAVANGVELISQVSSYPNEGERDCKNQSSLTNSAAWWNGLAPHATNSAAIYYTDLALRSLYAPDEDYTFPCSGFILDGGTLIFQTRTFEVPELWWRGGTLGTGNDKSGIFYSFISPKIHLLEANTPFKLRSYASCTIVMKGEIDGSSDLNCLGWSGTSMSKVTFRLDGPNTNFTGNVTVETGEIRAAYHNFEKLFPTFEVLDGRNLGGRKDAFDPRALKLTTLARLAVTNNAAVTLEDGLNRGVYISKTGRFYVPGAAGKLDVKWPLLLSGKMWKEGAGTLVLGKGLKHETSDGGALTDVPRAGSNLFEVVEGTVKIAHADALAGAETQIDAGAALKLAVDFDNADLTNYGIRNTSVDTPFTLDASFGGKLPLTLDTTGVVLPENSSRVVNALVTVKSASADAVRAMLPKLKPWRKLSSEIVTRVNGDNTTTFLLESKFTGMTILFR